MQLQGLPDEQKQQYIDNVQRNVSAGLYGLNSRNSAIGGVAGVVGQANEGAKNLLVADSQQRLQNIKEAQQAKLNYGDYVNNLSNALLNQSEDYLANFLKANTCLAMPYIASDIGISYDEGAIQNALDFVNNNLSIQNNNIK